MRVAYTMEQCWHDVPGGTAVATLRVADELTAHHGIELVGVAGRHRRPPVTGFEPTIPVSPSRRLVVNSGMSFSGYWYGP